MSDIEFLKERLALVLDVELDYSTGNVPTGVPRPEPGRPPRQYLRFAHLDRAAAAIAAELETPGRFEAAYDAVMADPPAGPDNAAAIYALWNRIDRDDPVAVAEGWQRFCDSVAIDLRDRTRRQLNPDAQQDSE